MHVIVLGAGVVGVTTAYYLAQLGYRVTVVDRANEVGQGASFANGGQLSYSFTDSLATPGFVAQIPRLMLGLDPGSRINMTSGLIGWGLRFLSQCTNKRATDNTVAVLQTAMRSAKLMAEIREQLPFEFHHRPAGKLVLLNKRSELDAARARAKLKHAHGCNTELLTRDEAVDVEPALAEMSTNPIAAVFSRSDEVADAHAFVTGLKDWLERSGSVTFKLPATAGDILVRDNKATAVLIDGEVHEADAVVVCLGAWSAKILKRVGIDPHIFPVRGYSVTLPPGDNPPSVSISALQQRIVFSRINGYMRIAGFADFQGFDKRRDDRRLKLLLDTAARVAPQAADYSVNEAGEWGGFRPMTPNGRPLVGATGIDGLYTNTGHGMLGWTLACASGYDAAQAVMRIH